MNYNKEEILNLYSEEVTKTEVAKIYAEMNKIPYSDNIRKGVSKVINKHYKKEEGESNNDLSNALSNETETETNQYNNIQTLSALKPDGSIMNIEEYCAFYNIPFNHVRTYKLVTHSGKGAFYNIASNVIETECSSEFAKNLLLEIESLQNLPKLIERNNVSDEESYLLIVDPADVHISKLAESFETGEDYNSQIAVKRVKEGVEGILDKVSGFKIDKIMFVGGNDILHIDTPKKTTTSGTPQDTDCNWYTAFLTAKQLYIEVLNRLLKVADVHFVYNPSNHDYMGGFFLADVIKTYYKDCPNITFDCSISHRKYFKYGKNLIGTSHGDGGKSSDLPLVMAHESKDWSNCKHRYFYIHHIHHKSSKDYMGVTVESLRSPSGTDSWHHRNMYQHAPKAIEGFLHSKEFGQIARITHLF